MDSNVLLARSATKSELSRWDECLSKNEDGGTFLSSRSFATAKEQFGWQSKFVVFERGGAVVSQTLILVRKIPLLGSLWYLPGGPPAVTLETARDHVLALEALAKLEKGNVFTITFEPPIPQAFNESGASLFDLTSMDSRFKPRPAIQGNAHTALVDLTRDEADILDSFDGSCRNKIRRAQKDGVHVEVIAASDETFDSMHRLMRLVGGGNASLLLRPKEYMENLWTGFTDKNQGFFLEIKRDDKPCVMGFLIIVGRRAFYKDGGSDRAMVSPGMSNLLVWEMIREAKRKGATELDLFGIAPPWAQKASDHPSYSLGLFKLSFARQRTDYVGAFDLVIQKATSWIWRTVGERITAWRHRTRYRDIGMY